MSLFLSKLITPGKNYFSKCSCKYSLQFQFLNSYDLLKYAFKTLSKLKTIISESEKYGQLFKSRSPQPPREGWHKVGKMDPLIFRPEITYGMLRIVI